MTEYETKVLRYLVGGDVSELGNGDGLYEALGSLLKMGCVELVSEKTPDRISGELRWKITDAGRRAVS